MQGRCLGEMAVDQKNVFRCPSTTPVTQPFVAGCCYTPLSRMHGKGMPHYKRLVASQEILLQAYLPEWPPKPVTDPVFLIRSQMPRVFIVVCSELWDCRSLQGLESKL